MSDYSAQSFYWLSAGASRKTRSVPRSDLLMKILLVGSIGNPLPKELPPRYKLMILYMP